jgi:hypothetical protein
MLTVDGVAPIGLRLIVICNHLSGLWLHVPASKSRKCLVLIFECFMIATIIFSIIFSIYRQQKSESFLLFMLIVASVLSLSHLTFTSVSFLIYKKLLIDVIKEAQCLIRNCNFNRYQHSLLQRISKRCLFCLIIPMISFALAQGNTMYQFHLVQKAGINVTEDSSNTSNREEKIINTVFINADSMVPQHLFVFNTIAQAISFVKIISTDALFWSLIYFVGEQLDVLALTLHEAMLAGSSPSTFKTMNITTWLDFQRRINR